MKTFKLFPGLLAVALIASVPAAGAKVLPDADTREVRAYTLTDAAFARYVKATHALHDAKFENCIAGDDDDDDPFTHYPPTRTEGYRGLTWTRSKSTSARR